MLSFLLNFLLLINFQTVSAAEFTVPVLTGPVVDQARILSPATKNDLERFLRQILDRGGAQIQVATVQSLGGLSIEEASIKITDQWKLGKKKDDRGLLLLLAPTEREVRIEVGQGLEGSLPDVTASRIIREVMTPQLKKGSADRAIIDGVTAIVQYTDPQLVSGLSEWQLPVGAALQSIEPVNSANWLSIFLWLFFILLFILPRFFGGRRGVGTALAAGVLLGGLGGRNRGGGWSGGGGGFSGGGASGRW